MRVEEVTYQADGLQMRSQLYLGDADGKRPGILVFPEVFGLGEHAKARAKRLAELGYAALACDIHGNGTLFESLDAVRGHVGPLREDPRKTRLRAQGALDALVRTSDVDSTRIAAIGFCFGGSIALELARSGAALAAVVGFHCTLRTSRPQDASQICGRVLVAIGADDPSVNMEQRNAFEQEMRAGGVDWQMHLYGGVVHSFTNENADRMNRPEAVRYSHPPTNGRGIPCWPCSGSVRYNLRRALDQRRGIIVSVTRSMPVPDFQSLFVPVLQALSDGADHSVKQLRADVVRELQLAPADLAETLPKSKTNVFVNRVAWALVHLKKKGAITSVGSGIYRIADHGKTLLGQTPEGLTIGSLGEPDSPTAVAETLTPAEQIESSFSVLQNALAEEVLARVKSVSPGGFEQLVLDLLQAIGYGAALEEPATKTGQTGDGGIDGTIKQDKLGLDVVYVQAKRWQGSVGSPEVMKFCGSLTAHHAQKGVMLTTSHFTYDAIQYAAKLPQKIVLIGGKQLAALMIEHNVGVALKSRFLLKRLNEDYFESFGGDDAAIEKV